MKVPFFGDTCRSSAGDALNLRKAPHELRKNPKQLSQRTRRRPGLPGVKMNRYSWLR